ncbi:MAG: sulfatase-like hydrolase/transferase [Acidobacteriota bacterium]
MKFRVERVLVLAALAVLVAAAFPLWRIASAEGAPRPIRDVVLVTIDTCRADAVGFGGNTRGTTPHLDAAAADGLVFSFAHGQNVLTLPSHVNILTGLYPFQHGVRDNTGFRLEDRFATAATILRERGYATGAFVAAFPLDSRYGLARGFDVYDMLYRQSEDSTDFRVQQAAGPVVVSAALDWYRKQAGRPRFLWVHVYDPHAPYDPPAEFRKRFADNLYLGDVAFADAALAPLLDAVRAADAPPTLLVVTADHGESLGEHGELTHGLFAYEATLHVPLFLWSRELPRKGRDTALARHIDILPTILDAVGDRTARQLPGASLLSDRAAAASRTSYFESLSASFTRGWAPLRGLLEDGQKYIDLPVPEQYDLTKDPAEKNNLAAQRLPALRKMRAELLRFPTGPVEPGKTDADQAARLRSLGYLSGSSAAKGSYGLADDPKNLIAVDRQIHQAVELYERGDKAGALRVTRELVARNPKMQLGYQHLAFLLEEKGDAAGAIKVLERAAANGVASEALDRRHGLLLAEEGRPRDAAALLGHYAKSRDAETLNALGIALADSGKIDDALEVFRRVLAADPSNVQAFQNIGIALLKGDRPGSVEKAREALEKSIALGLRNPKAWNALGVAWMRSDAPAKALDAWARCVEYGPEEYDALYNMGLVALKIGDRARAKQSFEKFLASAPEARYARERAEVRKLLKEVS